MTVGRPTLESDAGVVVVTAPAGFGKTYEAAGLAQRWAAHLQPPQQVLVLAHTNAAVEEFRRRTRAMSGRVHATTFDGFAAELLRPYAGPLGFPVPLQRYLGEPGGPDFPQLAPAAAKLLGKAPTLVRLLAHKYPLVILDEHQDSTCAQHAVAATIASQGLLRIFGDPMQAIYGGSDTESLVDWKVLEAAADDVTTLDTPQRWADAPALGAWLWRAREALEANQGIPADELPDEVTIQVRSDMDCAGFGAGDPRQLGPVLHHFLDSASDRSVAVLAYRRRLAEGLPGISRGRLPLNEGADYEAAYAAARALAGHLGDPQSCARTLLDLLEQSSTGLTQPQRARLEHRFRPEGIDLRRAGKNRPLLEAFQGLWAQSDLDGVRRAAAGVLEGPRPDWLKLRKPQALEVLAAMHASARVDPRDAVAAAVKARKLGAAKPSRCASTVHKAKGLQFDDVLVINASGDHFPDTDFGRKLVYVAITRATRRLHIVVPGAAPSPLFALPA